MNKIYRFEVYPSYTTGSLEFVVKYYDIPVIGSGETIEEAIAEAQENLEFYLEYCEEKGVAVPQPTMHEKLDDFSGKITFRTSKTLHKRISDRAKKEGISINSLINEAVNEYVTCNNFSEKISKDCSKELAVEAGKLFNEAYDSSYKNNYSILGSVNNNFKKKLIS